MDKGKITCHFSYHLKTFRYSWCIRQEAGYCCVQYQACTDANSFSIDSTIAAAGTSQVDSLCTLDFVTIPGKFNIRFPT